MKQISMNLGLALALSLGLAAPACAGATPAPSPVPSMGAAAAPSAKPAPTPKPLYVDYVPPDWAKAKEHITLEQAKKWVKNKNYLFCDARAKVEYDQGHIPGAIPLPVGEFDKYYLQHLKRIKKAKMLVTYCHGIGCRLSEKSANSLVDKGFKNVAVFFGGWPQWTQDNLPIEKGDTFASDEAPVVTPTVQPTPAHAVTVMPSSAPSPEAGK